MKDRLRTEIARDKRDKDRLIVLRTMLYRAVGKHQLDSLMTDQFDETALLVGVWKDESPIATVRILHRASTLEWEHDRFLQWPSTFPPREESVEMSRLCIIPKERSLLTIRELCSGIAAAMLVTRKQYVIACCTDDYVHLYKKFFGCVFTENTIIHVDLGLKVHRMFFCDMTDVARGRRISLWIWMSIWARPTFRALYRGELFSSHSMWARVPLFLKCAAGVAIGPMVLKILAFYSRRHHGTNRIGRFRFD